MLDSGGIAFTVLGPVRVWRDGVELDPGPPQRRAVLALLLANSGEPVSLDAIIRALWTGELPASAANVVHRHIGELRRLLEPGLPSRDGGRHLVRGPAGYQVRVPDGAVDLLRFRQLTRKARQQGPDAAGSGTAVDLYLEALGLWQGPAGSGIPPEVRSRQTFSALDRERLQVVREAADTALRSGAAGRVTAVLRESAAAHPLDESLQARLVLALAGCGRPEEALATFEEVRRRLSGELGISPGPELCLAQEEVLAGRAAPAGAGRDIPAAGGHGVRGPGASGSQSPGTVEVPGQLPMDSRVFAGRSDELDRMLALLDHHTDQNGQPASVLINAIAGMAGVGKTTLAVHLAHLVADRFPGGHLYIDLRGFGPSGQALSPGDVLRGFLLALGAAPERIPDTVDAQAALYRTMIAGRRVLLVLDNATDVEQVRPLLPGNGGCLVLVTSRNRLLGLVATEGAHPMTLDVLTHTDALETLTLRLGADRIDAEPAAADEIISLSARLPLALAVIAARAAAQPALPLAALVSELRAAHGTLDVFAGTGTGIDTRSVFSWSYRELAPVTARLFRLLSLHPGPDVTLPAAACLAALPDAATRTALADLTRAHLLTEHLPGRYIFHDLLRAYAVELTEATDSPEKRHAAIRRMLYHCLHTAQAAASVTDSEAPAFPGQPVFADAEAAMSWFTSERRVLTCAVRQAAAIGFPTHAWKLTVALECFYERRGHWHEWAALQRTALHAAEQAGDRSGRAFAHRGLGKASAMLRHYDEALHHLRHALGLFVRLDDPIGQARTHRIIGWVMTRTGRHREALFQAQQALEIYATAGHPSGQAHSLNSLAHELIQLGDSAQAVVHARQALATHRSLGDGHSQANGWNTLAYAHHHLGHYEKAISCYLRAIELFTDHDDRYNEAGSFSRLGDTHRSMGNSSAAQESWRTALNMLGDLDPAWSDEIGAKLRRTAVRQ